MNFVSLEFLLFFPLVLLLYWLLPFRFRWILLLAASYFFYLYWAPWTLLLLLGTTLITYIAARAIAGAKSKRKRVFWMVLALAACLGCLVVFKYLGFLADNMTAILHLFGAPTHNYMLNIYLPVGISFYTFQTLSYVIDVYRGDIQAETHFGYYALFISYFPQLVAGPIERPSNLLPQLRAPHQFKAADMVAGLLLTLRGFFKKLVIADYFATFVEVVYGTPSQAGGPAISLATVLFAFQIYCDFSGYSDIAVGVARMMGIRLINNFNDPYSATSIQDFWRRWHISLTTWFTDYIYIPLGGSRRGIFRHCCNIMIIFLISGLWHGASWTYIIWGGIHGFYLLVGILWRNLCEHWGMRTHNQPTGINRATRRFTTFVLVCFAWIFFRANSLADVAVLFGRLLSGWSVSGLGNTIMLMQLDAMAVARMVLMFACLPLLRKLTGWPVSASGSAPTLQDCADVDLTVFILITLIALGWLALLSANAGSSFIYFQF
jgi:D-alanyl-lipoteichoic acid acyltransferase DltB (MBOAT superfamily)